MSTLNLEEYERMRAENAKMRTELSYHVHTDEDIKIQNNTIEKLRQYVDEGLAREADMRVELRKLRAEKMRAENADLDGRLAGACKTIKELVQERDKLRAALGRIANRLPEKWPDQAIARAALNGGNEMTDVLDDQVELIKARIIEDVVNDWYTIAPRHRVKERLIQMLLARYH